MSTSPQGDRPEPGGSRRSTSPARVRQIKDPLERAKRAAAEYAASRERAREYAQIRREAFVELHETVGMTWREIGDEVGMRPGSVEKVAANRASDRPRWWERVPQSVAEPAKLGPRGLPREELFDSEETMRAIERVLLARGRRRRGVALSPSEMLGEVGERLGREIPMPALRVGLRRGIDEGRIVRVARGRYQVAPGRP